MNILLQTADGVFSVTFSSAGLTALSFPKASRFEMSERPSPEPEEEGIPREWINRTQTALEACLTGAAPKSLPPLDLSVGTEFQRAVWNVLLTIAPGTTRTYSEIARFLARPQAMRAVGQACGANPIPVLVPCHRVLAADSRLGGFSGGLDWKRRLLERERISFKEPRVAQSSHRGTPALL